MNCLSNKNKKVSSNLNYIEHFFTLALAVTFFSISVSASLVNISKEITSSTIGFAQ